MKKRNKIVLYIIFGTPIILFLISTFVLYTSHTNWTAAYNIISYGHPSPINFIGMTREQLFDWAEKHRTNRYDVDIFDKIAFGVPKQIFWNDNIDFFKDDFILNSDKYYINYHQFMDYGYYIEVSLKDGVVVSQKSKWTHEW